jgi:histone-lysine N-methyltransferase SETD8
MCVFARRRIAAKEYLFDYAGEIIKAAEAEKRHKDYSLNSSLGSFILWFRFDGKKWAVDATVNDGTWGRLVNHTSDPEEVNVRLQPVRRDGKMVVEMYAIRDIEVGSEILYDYNDRDPDTMAAFPFLQR